MTWDESWLADTQRAYRKQIAEALKDAPPRPPESDGRAAVEEAIRIVEASECDGPECSYCGCHPVAVAALKAWLARA